MLFNSRGDCGSVQSAYLPLGQHTLPCNIYQCQISQPVHSEREVKFTCLSQHRRHWRSTLSRQPITFNISSSLDDMFRDLSALPSCSETIQRQTEGGIYPLSLCCGIISVPVQTCSGELFILLSPCTVHLYFKQKTSHPCFYLSTVKMYLRTRGGQKGDTHQSGDFCLGEWGKTRLLAAKQMQRSPVNLGSESRVAIVSELWMNSQSGSLEGLRVALSWQSSCIPSCVEEVSGGF